jgi:uncharacterized protein (DUF488 family)
LIPNIVTIGVYGFRESTFFDALQTANVDTFCDIRARRGLRGLDYAFANSVRLQDRLRCLQIRYLHLTDFAPSPEVRKKQRDDDARTGVAKRVRTELGSAFIHAYENDSLPDNASKRFIDALPSDARVVALCCVERLPEACHRSLVATRLEHDLGARVKHLLP